MIPVQSVILYTPPKPKAKAFIDPSKWFISKEMGEWHACAPDGSPHPCQDFAKFEEAVQYVKEHIS